MASFDAREIANFFLDYADSKHTPISNMSLQKIVYYAHGWHLVEFGEPLISNKLEAWRHGPVVTVLYDSFKNAGDAPIEKIRARRFDVGTGQHVVAQGNFSEDLKSFLMKIFDFYSRASAYELSRMTHEEGSPWDNVMNPSGKSVCLRMEIQNDIILKYFSEIKNRAM